MQAQYSAGMIVAVDESSKDDRTIFRIYGRSPANSRAVIDAPFVRGERWSVVAALTTMGYLGYRAVSGSVDAFEFFDFIVQDIVSNYSLVYWNGWCLLVLAAEDEPVATRP